MHSNPSPMNLWANFLDIHYLSVGRVGNQHCQKLVLLCQELGKIERPKIRPYTARLMSRRLVCQVAMDLGIDLTAMKGKDKKMAMHRGLLDIWNQVYKEKYGDTFGTPGAKEVVRRNVKTKLGRKVKDAVQ